MVRIFTTGGRQSHIRLAWVEMPNGLPPQRRAIAFEMESPKLRFSGPLQRAS